MTEIVYVIVTVHVRENLYLKSSVCVDMITNCTFSHIYHKWFINYVRPNQEFHYTEQYTNNIYGYSDPQKNGAVMVVTAKVLPPPPPPLLFLLQKK